MAATTDTRTTDRIYAVVALVAAVLTFVESPKAPWCVVAVLVALVPWALVTLGREPPTWLFLALAVLPLIPIVLTYDVGVVLFMTTAAASRFASRTDDLRLVLLATAVVVLAAVLPMLVRHQDPHGAGYFAFGDTFGVLVGVLLRRTHRLAERLRQADASLVEARGREERQRIARDVHDLVAHSLTVVVLHVGGARRVLRADPAAAEAALADAERVCRESLDGIRGVVGLLRDEDAPAGVSLDLDALVGTYRDAGLEVVSTVDGNPGSLPLVGRVVLYRVLQEALANAARHAHGAVAVAVRIDDATATVRVENPRGEPRASAGGFGLTGLREQVAAVGGELSGGPEGDRWVVACRLPVVRRAVPSA